MASIRDDRSIEVRRGTRCEEEGTLDESGRGGVNLIELGGGKTSTVHCMDLPQDIAELSAIADKTTIRCIEAKSGTAYTRLRG